MPTPGLTAHFEEQAGWCEQLGSPFTAELLRRFSSDVATGGILSSLLSDWPTNPRADALGLRLAGALHYAVLSNKSDALKTVYPTDVTEWDIGKVWPVANSFISENTGWIRAFLKHPPQTNETRRAFMLLIGLKHIARKFQMQVHFLEPGASAGLNQNFDAFFYQTDNWQWGDPTSPMKVTTQWNGPAPDLEAPLILHERKACDQNPLDLTDLETRLRLKSYVWADQTERLTRFDAAADLAIARDTFVEKADAADWIGRELANRPSDMVTVIFHSVFFQYPSIEIRNQITSLIETSGASADEASPVVWLRYEPESLWTRNKEIHAANMTCDLRIWPGDEHITLARSDGHVRNVIAY
jgi:hypothetical protein